MYKARFTISYALCVLKCVTPCVTHPVAVKSQPVTFAIKSELVSTVQNPLCHVQHRPPTCFPSTIYLNNSFSHIHTAVSPR